MGSTSASVIYLQPIREVVRIMGRSDSLLFVLMALAK